MYRRARDFWGAHAPRVLVAAPRRNELCSVGMECFAREAKVREDGGVIARTARRMRFPDSRCCPRDRYKALLAPTRGSLDAAQAFVPLLKKSDNPRIVNVSSVGGQLADGADGWAPAYCISKTALNGVTVQLAAALPDFAVNSVCPGWVRTDMGGANATRSVAEGASGVVWLASEAPHSLTGKFLRDRK